MACQGSSGDYLCEGWRQRAAQVRARDGERCRGCNRSSDVVRLEVHHRRYGPHGTCGSCVLTGISDDDLITLCGGTNGCHEAITNVRRGIRYGDRVMEPVPIDVPAIPRIVVTTRIEMDAEPLSAPSVRIAIPARRFVFD